jgi:hypothetical protein
MLRIKGTEVSFESRGFESSPMQGHLQSVGASFLFGYHLALDDASLLMDRQIMEDTSPLYRGFVFEGAAMALAILDALSIPKQNQWETFLRGIGAPHRYVVHVGLGWAYARIPWYRRSPEKGLKRFDPLLKWLILDGFGFHEGYFHWKKWLAFPYPQPTLSEYGKRAFDQGLGRSLWFVKGANVSRIATAIESMQNSRRGDLWSGIGLAASYAGIASDEEIADLVQSADSYREHLAQGITFGAEARMLAGIPADHNDRICKLVCGLTASEAAELTRTAKPEGASRDSDYETWRSNIRECLRSRVTV